MCRDFLRTMLCACLTASFLLVSENTATPKTSGTDFSEPAHFQSSLEVNSKDLIDIAEKYSDVVMLEGEAAIAHDQQVDDVLSDPMLSSDEKEKKLNLLGVYSVYEDYQAEFASSRDDVVVYKPSVYYDSQKKLYVISSYGNWKNKSYEKDWSKNYVGYYHEGGVYKVGNKDAVAISLQMTGGSQVGLELVSGYGKGYSYSDSSFSVTSSTLCTGDDLHGAAYEIQDKIKCIKHADQAHKFLEQFRYNCEYFTCTLRYNSKFANFSGSVTMHYVHTWKSTKISSISLSATPKGGSLSVSFSSGDNSFPAYSGGKAIVDGK